MTRAGILLLVLLLGVGACGAFPVGPDDPSIRSALDFLRGTQKSDGGFGEANLNSTPGTTDWAIMAIVSAGEDPRTWVKDGNSPLDYHVSMHDEILAKGGSTDIARTILSLKAMGEDPRAFQGTDYVEVMKTFVKPSGQVGDHVYTTQWTVLALAAMGEPVDASVDYIVSQQNPDGGIPWTPGAESDPDDTGAALMAFAAAGVPDDNEAVRRAVEYLRNEQMEDGGFHYGGTSASNSASDAWVIQGLVASGENPATWVRNGVSAAGHLQLLQNPSGAFNYTTYVIDNPARMTASSIPAVMGIPYPVYPGSVSPLPLPGNTTVATTEATTTNTSMPTGTTTTQPDGWVVTVTDDFGETVTVHGPPTRIISLAPSNTEILYALNLSDRVIGVTDYCNYPPEAHEKQKVGGYSTVNIEKVVALKPDLVLASFGNTESAIEHLRSLGLTVVALNPLTIDDVFENIELVGRVTGTEPEASALNEGLRQRIEAVTDKTAGLADRPSVAQVVWYDPIWVSGNNTFEDEVIRMAGGTNAFASTEGWAIVGLEEFVVTDPEFVIVNSGTGMGESSYDILQDYFENEPRFRNVSAVQDGHVYTVDADIISRGGPRIVDALEQVAALVHPEVFGNATPLSTPTPRAPGFGYVVAALALGSVALLSKKR